MVFQGPWYSAQSVPSREEEEEEEEVRFYYIQE